MKLPSLPPLEDEDRAFLHYNPNTQDLEDFVRAYALQYAESVREACAQIADRSREDMLLASWRGSRDAAAMAGSIAAAIRMKEE